MKASVLRLFQRIRGFFLSPMLKVIEERDRITNIILQKNLFLQYQQMLHADIKMPMIGDVGFSIFSESDEDGILHYIFSVIGITNKNVVDIGAGAIQGSNTANLIINNGWKGLLIDGNKKQIDTLANFYAKCLSTKNFPPKTIYKHVTVENINKIIIENRFRDNIDLLCIDIDGIDYWIWKAIECISPRVVVVEYQCIWGAEKSVTIPYNPNFKAEFSGRFCIYSGASLSAFVKLASKKGYRLIGCQRYGYNAFFLRNDIDDEILKEVPVSDCFRHPFTKWARDQFLDRIKDKEWIEV